VGRLRRANRPEVERADADHGRDAQLSPARRRADHRGDTAPAIESTALNAGEVARTTSTSPGWRASMACSGDVAMRTRPW
jgi:hypothetical protein